MHPDVPESMSPYLETPALNRLAREGMVFSSGYSPAPLCTPTRRSIQVGATAARSGTEFDSGRRPLGVYEPHKHLTIPKALKQADPAYRTAHFGKWGWVMVSTPAECGYDASDGMTTNGTGGMDGGLEKRMKPFYVIEDPKRTASVTSRAIDFMKSAERDGKPFYVQVSYYAVHRRIELLQETLDKYKKKSLPDREYSREFAGMMEEMDQGVGRLLDAIGELKTGDNTYVFFMSDNGGAPPGDNGGFTATERTEKGPLAPNHPLRGNKQMLYEGGIRVPFMVSGPGVPQGIYCHEPVAGYDLLPTFYDLAGGEKTLPDEVDGVSLRPLLDNDPATVFTRPFGALVFHRPADKRHASAIRQGDHKLYVTWKERGNLDASGIATRSLYDLSKDIGEENNLYEENRELAAQLEKKLLDYLKAVNAEKPAF
jgi:arylsulfatase A-like enzyme